jgi:hypothetical protein
VRPATLVRMVLGGACLAAPGQVLAAVGGPDRDDAATLVVTRVLGARLVLQAGADIVLGTRTRWVDVAVDSVHAASMIPVAVLSDEHRRTALVSLAAATTTAALDAATDVGQPGM